MSGPWEKFRQEAPGKPWERFQGQTPPPEGQDTGAASDAPWYAPAAQAGRAAMDIGRIALDTPTLGFGDRLLAGIETLGTGRPYDETLALHRKATTDARERAGWAGTATDLVTGVSALSRVPSLVGSAKGLGKALVAAGEGAGYGALSAVGHGSDVETGAATGAAGGVAGLAAGKVAGKALDAGGQAFKRLAGQAPKVPSTEEMNSLAHAAYQRADDAGVWIARPALQRMRQDLVDDLTEFGYHPKIQTKTAAALSEVNRIAQGHTTLKGLYTARKIATNGFGADRSDNKALGKVVKHIDRLIDTLSDADVIMGDRAAGVPALREGIDLWKRAAKAQGVEQALETAANRQGSERATRTLIGKIPQKQRGLTPDEVAAANDIAQGTLGRNVVTYAGRALAPSSGALGSASTVASLASALYTGNPTAAALPLGGLGAKFVSDRVTRHKARALAAMMRAGGTRSALRGPDNLPQRLAQPVGDRVSNALLAAALARMQQPQD